MSKKVPQDRILEAAR